MTKPTATRFAMLPPSEPADILSFSEMRQCEVVFNAAVALLIKIEDMTTHDFSIGGEKPEREALRAALVAAGYDDMLGVIPNHFKIAGSCAARQAE